VTVPGSRPGEAPAPEVRADEVAVLAPTGRDAELAGRVLGRWNLRVVPYTRTEDLCAAIVAGPGVGAVMLAEEALRPRSLEALIAALEAQPAWSDVPLVLLTVAGELSSVLTRTVAVLTERGNVTLLERPVRVATLVTVLRSALRARERQYDVRDALAEVEAARAEAEDANRAKGEFLAVMSHELRTPLNAIGGYAELMDLGIHGPVTTEQREALRRMQKSQRHLLGLINGVLNYARVERGTLPYELADVDLDEVLATAEALVSPQVRARGLSLRYPGCAPDVKVRADREKVQQIVLNLLTNAIKFTEPGGTVRIDCAAADGTVTISVADTGVGVPPDKLTAIFEPFVQVDSRLTRTKEGVGLGLAISRDLARGMGGELTAESEVGKGSVFRLTLPGTAKSE
jgi:signal transduction histidine kinase